MEKRFKIHPEVIFDFLLFVLGAVILIVSLGYGFGTLKSPGPGMYPFFVGLIVVCFGGVIVIKELRSGKAESRVTASAAKTFVLMIVTCALWIVVMPFLGYVIVTFLATYAFCKIMKLEGWVKPLALSIGTAVFVYLLFDYWLYIDLPRGILG